MNTYTGVVRLTNDPKAVGNGKAVVFSVADNYTEIKNGIRQSLTLFISCTIFGYGKDYALKYLKKGSEIFITGTIKNDSYTDKNGIERTNIGLIVNSIQRVGKPETMGNAEDNDDMPNFTDDDPFK